VIQNTPYIGTAGAPLAVAAPLAGAYGVLSGLALVAAAPARTR
jgi:hypothetical protein